MRFISLLRIALTLCALALTSSAESSRPNIVLIFADDLGINDLGCYGRKDHVTPNLDRLASQGARFTTAYCAQPICSPSRASLLTGKSPARLHLTTFLPGRPDATSQKLLHPKIAMQLPLEETTLAEALKPAGYSSACIGKWHLGGQGFGPASQGFDFVFAGQAKTQPSADEGGKGEYGLTAKALEFIDTNKERPFFLYLAHNSPHVPLGAKPELINKHRDAFNPLYAAMIETLDDSIGRVLAKLDELKLAEKTIVAFTSDNGGLHILESPNTPATHNGQFRAGKGYLYEGGLREPLIVRWPNEIKAGSVIDTPVSISDLFPTFLELSGQPLPANLDFQSITGLLRGEKKEEKPRSFFWHFPHYTNQGSRPAGAIRDGDWKLIEHYEDGRLELFNLSSDPGESMDVAAQNPPRVAAMRGALEAWRRSVGAQENTPNPDFEPLAAKPCYQDIDTSLLTPLASASATAEKLSEWRRGMNAAVNWREGQGNSAPVPTPTTAAGFIELRAKDASVHGEKLRYEPQPQKDTLGFWVNAADWASWDFDVKFSGTYEVVLLQGCGKGSGGATVELGIGEQKLDYTVAETGHFQAFVPKVAGKLNLSAGKQTLTVRPKAKPGAAVMDLRRVTLTRVPEGATAVR
ncbi:sulfatase-like hydrolase/transferase [Verrucomicrobiota bacterium sgz303538]